MVGAIVAWSIAGLVVVAIVFGWVFGRSRKRKDTGLRTSLMQNERMEREAELRRGQSQAVDKVRQFPSP
jgi:hypothetical protein